LIYMTWMILLTSFIPAPSETRKDPR
jgi:hypothetical protein